MGYDVMFVTAVSSLRENRCSCGYETFMIDWQRHWNHCIELAPCSGAQNEVCTTSICMHVETEYILFVGHCYGDGGECERINELY